jgi:hypothetical protein
MADSVFGVRTCELILFLPIIPDFGLIRNPLNLLKRSFVYGFPGVSGVSGTVTKMKKLVTLTKINGKLPTAPVYG